MFKVNNKDTRMLIANFEHVIASWVTIAIACFYYKSRNMYLKVVGTKLQMGTDAKVLHAHISRSPENASSEQSRRI